MNEKQEHYLESLECLKEKCYRSHFNKKLTNKIIKLASRWTDRFHPNVIKKKKRIMWTTLFPKLLKLTSKEKSLKPEATVTYRNPPTLSNNLLNYKQIAFQTNHYRPGSFFCENCALCGNYGQHISMIQHTKVIRCNNKYLNLKQKLNCKNYGIYVAECKNCDMQNVGQIINKFSVRRTADRSNWNKFKFEENNDKAALLKHYAIHHKKFLVNKPCISNRFRVIFIEQPNKRYFGLV